MYPGLFDLYFSVAYKQKSLLPHRTALEMSKRWVVALELITELMIDPCGCGLELETLVKTHLA